MSWRGTEGGIRAARQGNEVVMAPTTHCYFDYYQTADTAGEPLAWGGCLPLEKVYALSPCEGLDSVQRASVLGVQANLWTEYIPDFAQAQYMLLPRLGALAEVVARPERLCGISAAAEASDAILRCLRVCLCEAFAGGLGCRSQSGNRGG